MRVVLDTDVMVAALRSDRGASRKVLSEVLDGRVTALLSVPLIVEYEAVLTRPEHLAAASLEVGDVEVILDAVCSVAKPVRLAFLWRPRLKDPADEMVLETAVNGRADVIVTFNMRHFGSAAKLFGIETMAPSDLWRILERRNDAQK